MVINSFFHSNIIIILLKLLYYLLNLFLILYIIILLFYIKKSSIHTIEFFRDFLLKEKMISLLYSLLNESKTVATKSIQALSLCADKCIY